MNVAQIQAQATAAALLAVVEARPVPAAPVPVLRPVDAERIQEAVDNALAANTLRAYAAQWRVFAAWCTEHGHQELPAHVQTVAAYLSERKLTVALATVRLSVASIAAVHKARRLPSPCDDEAIRKLMQGIARMPGPRQRQAAGITREGLAALRATACRPRVGRGGRMETSEHAQLRGRVDIAMIGLMFDGLLRRSEAAAVSWSDISRSEDGSGLLQLGRRKTDQEGEGSVLWLSPDTMQALAVIRPESAAPSDLALNMTAARIAARVKMAAAAAGLGDAADFSGHSPRVGCAQSLAAARVSLALIMQAGGWASARMPARYTERMRAQTSGVAQMYGA